MINKRKNTIIEKNNEIIQKLSKPVVEYHKIEKHYDHFAEIWGTP